jgi:hypothetical protein
LYTTQQLCCLLRWTGSSTAAVYRHTPNLARAACQAEASDWATRTLYMYIRRGLQPDRSAPIASSLHFRAGAPSQLHSVCKRSLLTRAADTWQAHHAASSVSLSSNGSCRGSCASKGSHCSRWCQCFERPHFRTNSRAAILLQNTAALREGAQANESRQQTSVQRIASTHALACLAEPASKQ